MAARQQYAVFDSAKGLLDRDIFTNEQVYQEELEKVFGRSWLFIGHESLIPHPNDFFLTYMGEDPVILTRDSKGAPHAFLNMCRHRGNRVVRADDGNAKNFMCTYHGWTFSNEGKLVSVPGLQEAYYGELNVKNLGLVPVAHLDTYAGFVFATWAEDAPTLEAYLGDMRWYMDIMFNRRDGGVELVGPDKWLANCNWKNPADNFIGDMHHGPSHQSAMIVQAKRWGQPARTDGVRFMNANQVNPGNGHGTCARLHDSLEARWNDRALGNRASGLFEYEQSIAPEVEHRLGPVRARISLVHHTLFPNMSWLTGGTVRIWHPRGPFETEIWSYIYTDTVAPRLVKDLVRIHSAFGPSGIFEQDDMNNWAQSTEAGRSITGRKFPQVLSMGLHQETTAPGLPGKLIRNTQGEINQRALYARWQEFMNAKSWADIHVDPITATFEGTATMKG